MVRLNFLGARRLTAASLVLLLASCKAPESPQVPDPNAAGSTLPSLPILQDAVELDAALATAPSKPFVLCNLETLDGAFFGTEPQYIPADKGRVELGGWLGSATDDSLPKSPVVIIKQEGGPRVWTAAITYNVPRGDVASGKGVPALKDAGFRVLVNLTSLPQGTYHVVLGDGNGSSCDNGRRLAL